MKIPGGRAASSSRRASFPITRRRDDAAENIDYRLLEVTIYFMASYRHARQASSPKWPWRYGVIVAAPARAVLEGRRMRDILDYPFQGISPQYVRFALGVDRMPRCRRLRAAIPSIIKNMRSTMAQVEHADALTGIEH